MIKLLFECINIIFFVALVGSEYFIINKLRRKLKHNEKLTPNENAYAVAHYVGFTVSVCWNVYQLYKTVGYYII